MGRVTIKFGISTGLQGLYLSGYSTLRLLGLDVPLHWSAYETYYQALGLPELVPYAAKVRLAGGIGFGVPLMAWLVLLIPLFKSRA